MEERSGSAAKQERRPGRRAWLALALFGVVALGACVIGPKPDDPLTTGASDAGADTSVTVFDETGGETPPGDAGVDATKVDDAVDPNAGCDGDASFDADPDAGDADAPRQCGDATADTFEGGADAPSSG